MQTDLIIVREYCEKCHIDPSFILMLEKDGLIEVHVMNKEKYLLASQLAQLEKYSRMYYDLSINIEGIDAINHLLSRMSNMQQEMQHLKNKLDIYRNRELEKIEDY